MGSGFAPGLVVLGELALWVALLMAAWSATVSFAGATNGRRDLVLSGERALYATAGFIVLASTLAAITITGNVTHVSSSRLNTFFSRK